MRNFSVETEDKVSGKRSVVGRELTKTEADKLFKQVSQHNSNKYVLKVEEVPEQVDMGWNEIPILAKKKKKPSHK